MQSAALSLPQGFRDAAKHSKAELSNNDRSPASVFSHVVAPSSRPRSYAERDEMTSEKTTRNARVSRNAVADRMRLAVDNAIPQHVETAKAAAQKIEVSPRTVEALRQRVPDAMVTVGMLGIAYPEFALAMAEMWGIDIDDPKGYAMFIAMRRSLTERMK